MRMGCQRSPAYVEYLLGQGMHLNEIIPVEDALDDA